MGLPDTTGIAVGSKHHLLGGGGGGGGGGMESWVVVVVVAGSWSVHQCVCYKFKILAVCHAGIRLRNGLQCFNHLHYICRLLLFRVLCIIFFRGGGGGGGGGDEEGSKQSHA